jgi:tripartite ATP-independent transporter DctM subunit
MTAEILLISILVLLCMNTPIAIAIGAASVIALLFQSDFSLMIVIQKMFGGADSFHLLAVPLFMFTGVVMTAGGVSRRLIDLADSLVGWLPGGMAAVTIVSAMFFAGISGSAAADAAAVGAILIPAMKNSGYRSEFAAAVQAAGGSIGVIIPPSIPMIIFAYLTGASVGRLFAAGILPGILIGISLIVVAAITNRRKVDAQQTVFSLPQLLHCLKNGLVPMGTPVIILGGILSGIFTATESAAIALAYGLFLGLFVYKEIRIKDLSPLFIEGAISSSIVMFIIIAASVFGWIAAVEEIPVRLASTLLHISDSPIVLLLIINLILLIAGTFVETTAALILLVPMIAAMQPTLGIDLIQLGVIVVTNLAIGMLTPPMGICLIVSASISGDRISAIGRAIIPFLGILLIDLLLITFYAPLTMLMANLVN